MKKLQKQILFFSVMCTAFLLIPEKAQAKEMLLDILCFSSSDMKIYEEPDIDADVLEERSGGEPVYVITPGIPWSTVFCNGKQGYALTECLTSADHEKLAEDKAFDGEALISEYGESLNDAYKAEMDEHRERKLLVICAAVIIVSVFAVADIAVVKMHKKKKETRKKEGVQNA